MILQLIIQIWCGEKIGQQQNSSVARKSVRGGGSNENGRVGIEGRSVVRRAFKSKALQVIDQESR